MYRFLIIALFVLTSFTTSQELVFWHTDVLGWEHFQATKNTGKGFDALVASGIQISTKDSAGHISIELKSYVDPTESWVVESSKTPRLLNHERRHFDITEISRRKLSLALQVQPGINSENLNEKVDSLFEAAMQWQSTMSDAYDSSTRHGLDPLNQIKWDMKIDALLAEYESLSETKLKMW